MTDFPDTYGLPEFYATKVVTEADGPNVRVVYGVMRGGQMQWLFSCVMRADLLIHASQNCTQAAFEALNGENSERPEFAQLSLGVAN
ncbi:MULTISPECIES: hypothetical protein [Bradyrhizobium]|uniref:hypothetical protein n=1 Tax=Bradyrhizobium elkanii TaxID=29448 RepID=UPI002714D145|nr:hypothetical protein [Bradyrhizobium elkanii]WLA44984.1 hypothetical protein QIH80_23890 [Bradyrhizobium elkanii]WLB84887.1 hypothetical protein QIH83_21005 [Bradyrhizobium elkanii]